jgi:hypothetical protein
MAPQYQRVYPKFWLDMRGQSTETKLAGLYVLTSKHRATEGLYHLPLAYAADDIEMSLRKVERAFELLADQGLIAYDPETQIVLIRKALTYPGQAPATDKQVAGAMRVIEHLPPTPLREALVEMATTHAPRFAAALGQSNGNPSESHT